MEQERNVKIESYRVRSPLVAMRITNNGPSRFVTVPEGAVIDVIGTPKPFDFVNVQCDGEALTVFDRDLMERTEKLDRTEKVA
jgi:hypothetical protein